MQTIRGRKGDRVQQEVQAAPRGADLFKYSFQLSWYADITGEQQFTAKGFGYRTDVWQRLVVQIGCSQGSALRDEGARAAGRDTGLIGNTDDQAAFAVQAGCNGC